VTTNRVTAIDEAFQSRIHIRWTYRSFDVDSRRKVWSNFLDRAGRKTDFSEEDIDNLANKDLNGRQIVNVLKTATSLAASSRETLMNVHVDAVLEIDGQEYRQSPNHRLRHWGSLSLELCFIPLID